ncbi:DUF1254 domain-containing protein [Crocinitomicaceae bacterium]|nr:DUF1254 domain-containing protein [Crocinitomicaceae bacterium]
MSERTKSIVIWTMLTLLLAGVVHVGVICAIPYIVGIRLRSMAEKNTLIHTVKLSADYNPIRRSSPDMIYTCCSFDLSNGPLQVSAPVPASDLYMSVSCFALNTDNFYVKNDRQIDGNFNFVLVGPDAPAPNIEDTELVRSPTTTGGILIRYFIGDGTREGEIEASRQRISIRPRVGIRRTQ